MTVSRKSRLRGIWLAVVAVLVGGGVATRPAAAATVDTSAWYVLVNRHSGKALDVDNLATHDGAPIVQFSRNDGNWQQWQFIDSGGHYRLRSRHSGKVLDIQDRSTADGAGLVQWADQNGGSQRFRLADSADGHVRLVNQASGRALDVPGTSDAARVAQRTDTDAASQQWRLVRMGGVPADYPNPGTVTGDTRVHDPAMVKRPGGGYLLAHTGDNIALKTSTDRTAFRDAGQAFPGGAPWTNTYTNGSRNLWAPDLSFHNGQYYLYYSASTFGSNRSAIFLATSPSGGSGTWTDRGLVIESRTSDTFNAIDPNLTVDDQGRWWMSFGSFWSGVKLVQLDPATGKRLNTTMTGLASASRIEAPYIVKRGSYYYLYLSFGYCCRGADSTYRTMVGRATSITGPYLDRDGRAMSSGGGTEILAGHGTVHGPGHPAVLADTDGDVLLYHWYSGNGTAYLGINRLAYEDGWPVVR